MFIMITKMAAVCDANKSNFHKAPYIFEHQKATRKLPPAVMLKMLSILKDNNQVI